MTLDARIKAAVREAVAELHQEMPLSDMLIAVLESLADGNLQLTDYESLHRRLTLLYDAVEVGVVDEPGQEE